MARNITDPERIEEYRKQKQMELEAMRRHEEEMLRYRQKQVSYTFFFKFSFYEKFCSKSLGNFRFKLYQICLRKLFYRTVSSFKQCSSNSSDCIISRMQA